MRPPAVAAALLIILSACTGVDEAPTPQATPQAIEGAWDLVSGTLDGVEMALVETHPVTLTFRGTEIGGISACSHYGGRISFADGAMRISEIGGTAMASHEEAMELETQYSAALRRVTAMARNGDQLVASGDGVELEFTLLPPPPTAEIIDTEWLMESVVTGEVAAAPMGEPATLQLRSDGTFRGSTGCRSFAGRWIENGARVDFPEFGMDGRECPAALAAQDSHVVSVLGDGFTATIDGDQLTLRDPTGEALLYRAEKGETARR